MGWREPGSSSLARAAAPRCLASLGQPPFLAASGSWRRRLLNANIQDRNEHAARGGRDAFPLREPAFTVVAPSHGAATLGGSSSAGSQSRAGGSGATAS